MAAHSYVVAQANLQRKLLATDELMLEAKKRKIAIALVQEPYVGRIKAMKSYGGARVYQDSSSNGGTVKAAIVVFDQDIDVIQCPKFTTKNIVVVKLRTSAWEILAVSYYFEPDQPIGPYLDHLTNVMKELGPRKAIFGGDANAKSVWWGSSVIDDRGDELAGMIGELDLQILNRGNKPTFDTIRGGRRLTSHVDVTMCTENLLDLVEDWMVAEDLTSSDHNGILITIKLKKGKGIHIKRTTRIYNTKKANWERFYEKLDQSKIENSLSKIYIEQINNKEQLDNTIEKYTKTITEACKEAIPIKKGTQTLTLPWWSEELEAMKHEVATRKGRVRCAAPSRRDGVVAQYLEVKAKYESEAIRLSTESWKQFCQKQNREGVWEGVYRVIKNTAKRQEDIPLKRNGKEAGQEGSARLLAETFYPEDAEEDDTLDHRRIRALADRVNDWDHGENHDPEFTAEELRFATESFNPKKAPGVDGFTADICQRVIARDMDLHLAILNKCLQITHFPTAWKEAIVVVLRKPGKDNYTSPKSYRPIGLLPVMGKILEKMLVRRLVWYLAPRMSPRQYGFMPQRSTEDSLYDLMAHVRSQLRERKLITVVSLDIEGAFDSAWWPAIKVRLAEEKCPVNLRRIMASYLSDRKVRVRYAGHEFAKSTNKGCVQGSIGGPILWNLVLNPLLESLSQRGIYCQAFADDVVLVFVGETAQEIQGQANAALEHVRVWGAMNKLKFAPHKTCAMVVTNKLKHDTPHLTMGGIDIGMSPEIKILGLTVDAKLTFNSHTANVCKKALGVYKQVSRAARVSWGLHPEIVRIIYTATVEPIITYAASAWSSASKKLGVQRHLNAVQRGFAQKLCGAYRTTSLHSALALSGILPLDLRIQEAAALYEARRGVTLSELADREVECRVKFSSIPHPAKHIALEFVSLVDQEQVDSHNNQEVRIFTDGSRIEEKVGAALTIWDSNAETGSAKLSLAPYCTVYQAELLAICRATEEIRRRSEERYGIYSDSRSALETIINPCTTHPLAVKTRKNLGAIMNQNKAVYLFWIKAHAGLAGNERADQLAKDAALKSKKRPDYDSTPISFIKRRIRIRSIDEWDRRYREGSTASVTKLFFPDITNSYRVVRRISPTNIITQVLTGHGGFSEYLNRFKCKETPSCICEPGTLETVEHILTECPVHALKRLEIENELGCKMVAKNFHKLISNKRTMEKFIEYCINIAKPVINRNK